MTWGEISKWAKEKGFKITRKDGAFSWNKLDNLEINGSESNLENTAKAIFNEISGHRWVKHQKDYERKLTNQI
jgi:hypothetical protein